MNTRIKNIAISDEDLMKLELIKALPPEFFTFLSAFTGGQSFNKPSLTLIKAERIYMEYLIEAGLSPSHVTTSKYVLKRMVEFFGAGREVNQVSYKDAEDFIFLLKNGEPGSDQVRKGAPKGCNNYLTYCKSIFTRFVNWGYLESNIFRKVNLPKVQRDEKEFITIEELRVINQHVVNEIIRDMFLTAFYSGLRRSELVNLSTADIDLGEKVIRLGKGGYQTKSRKQRVVPMSDDLFEILKKYPGDPVFEINKPNYLFRKKNRQRYTGNFIGKVFKKAVEKSGIKKNLSIHSLRHSFASNLIRSGKSIYQVKELLGHSDIKTTQVYSHLNLEDLREAVSCFNR